ncbi:Rieske (2Fe-2S) protein [Streptomonospora sp. NEAU-YY374]|nr:Rieske (2Fe-2S) protein [Streptomonospora nanhaiensis]MBV2365680.1 Rieske (2Fe-2S) protein [Streptomonospora nanhaiensis]MBX9388136.1 Rieske (2Fe-2S) protein [Streptomonospora nanhaiensis]
MSRRRLFGAAGVAGAAALGVSACGSPQDGPAPWERLRGTVIARTDEVPVGGGTIVIDGKMVLTQPAEGDFKAFSAVCTHAGCTIQEVERTIHCLCHGSEFDVSTGDVLKGPAVEALRELPITVANGEITLDEDAPAR